jgi:response regulator RpfG family c-di-GMP phosphodiesterase
MKIDESHANILVIDDEELDSVIFKIIMKRVLTDPHIESFKNAKIAIEKLSEINKENPEHLPDYIFLDLTMPEMNGWQFLAEFDKLKIDPLKKSKIYILSSSINNDDITRSKSNPLVTDFVSKPLDFNKIKNIFSVAN